ncbi:MULTISPECIES: PolC-type DNA polymerase III [unclassified Streptomyces]|uniref:PolC-type DNA polymerase III n=1 Tax=Streptomyces sp. NPDC055082 TaxID=3365718 RepID=UPI0037CF6F82
MSPITWPEPLYVVDVEGNGAAPPDLVEIALIPMVGGQPQPADALSWLIRPPVPIPHRITRIHNITNDMVEDAPAWQDIAPRVRSLLEGAWIAAHSASVEYGVLTRHLPGWQPTGVIDTLRLAKATIGGKGFGLDALIERTKTDLSDVAGARHRAAYDAHATALLLNRLASQCASWDALAAKAVPPGMPGRPSAGPEEGDTLW